MRKFVAAALALLVVSSPLGAGVPGSGLDGLWFKVKVKAKGLTYGVGVPKPKKASFSATVFVNLTFNVVPGDSYTVSVWEEDNPDVWTMIDNDSIDFLSNTGPELYLLAGLDFAVNTPGPESINCEGIAAVKASKFSPTGEVLKAKFTSLGMAAPEGMLGNDISFAGALTLKGKTVDVEDLPFVP